MCSLRYRSRHHNMKHPSREAQFEQLLQSDDIATHVLKAACLHGIPDNADLRAEAWRTLLGVVDLTSDGRSNDYAARKASKTRKRRQYYDLATELLGSQTSVSGLYHFACFRCTHLLTRGVSLGNSPDSTRHQDCTR